MDAGEKWDECVMCGARRIRALVHFDSGSVEPTYGETVTGATSGDTMVMDRYVLISGTYAGGDAVGVFEGTSPTGYNDIALEIFQNDENLNGRCADRAEQGNHQPQRAPLGVVDLSHRFPRVGRIRIYRWPG